MSLSIVSSSGACKPLTARESVTGATPALSGFKIFAVYRRRYQGQF